ncbi:GNAT family N-acetyltransferase [Granulicella cerasi]|uniref:GNAT family N-acetyltransferase n=1 Tax=Granulicella cerasi TaxID=741063 RepID=A0ABW1ZAP5_9BACT|nr:GNAT family N-acetyltransferase [Granulicella cerasi]
MEAVSTATPTGFASTDAEVVTLRRATHDDAAALALLGGATFLEAFTWMLPGADIVAFCAEQHTREKYAAYLAKPTTQITLAVSGIDAPVGYAMLTAPDTPSIETTADDIELKRIYLFSRFRSHLVEGVKASQALMDAAVADARAMGAKRLLLGTHAGNERAVRFYRRNGFEIVGTRTFQVGAQQCSDYILARPL